MIVNIHRFEDGNLGDILSSPVRYFDFGRSSTEVEILKTDSVASWLSADLIIGGGGLIGRPMFDEVLEKISLHRSGALVAWGIGHNSYESMDATATAYPEFLSSFDLVGLRDHNSGFREVPCASCMHSAFNRNFPRRTHVRFFEHFYKPLEMQISGDPGDIMRTPIVLPRKRIPVRKLRSWFYECEVNLKFLRVVRFLGGADCVVTNSYHAAYWSILMGKRVVISSFSTKFRTLFGAHSESVGGNWKDAVKSSKPNQGMLDYARARNVDFHAKVIDLFSKAALGRRA